MRCDRANPGSVDKSNRQRAEFLTAYGKVNDGQSWTYVFSFFMCM
jgi:hypothetical protein